VGLLAHHSLLPPSLVCLWWTPTFCPSAPVALPCRPAHFRCTGILPCPDLDPPGPRLCRPLASMSALARAFTLLVCACMDLHPPGLRLRGPLLFCPVLAWIFTLQVIPCAGIYSSSLCLCGPLSLSSLLVWTWSSWSTTLSPLNPPDPPFCVP